MSDDLFLEDLQSDKQAVGGDDTSSLDRFARSYQIYRSLYIGVGEPEMPNGVPVDFRWSYFGDRPASDVVREGFKETIGNKYDQERTHFAPGKIFFRRQ